jgi:hypothetical protein
MLNKKVGYVTFIPPPAVDEIEDEFLKLMHANREVNNFTNGDPKTKRKIRAEQNAGLAVSLDHHESKILYLFNKPFKLSFEHF